MGFFDKVKNIVNPKDIDEGYEDDEYVFDDNAGAPDYGTQYDTAYGSGSQATIYAPSGRTGSFAGVGVGSGVELNGSALELKVMKPKHWDSVNQIADHLISKRTVVLNLEDTNKEDARRMIDFLLGVVYTIEGDIKKVANNTWVITPNNVDLSQDNQQQTAAAGTQTQQPSAGMQFTSM